MIIISTNEFWMFLLQAMEDYEELCRTKMSIVNSPQPDEDMDKQQQQQVCHK